MPSDLLLSVGAGALASATLLHAGPAVLAVGPANALLGVHKRLRDHRRVAITFDDGPQPLVVEQFLKVLDDHRTSATFFLVGERAAEQPDLVRQIKAAGHELANHGLTHGNHLLRSPVAVAVDIERGAETIGEIVGARPALFRPPYGVVAAATRVGAWRARNRLVLWSRWGRDWRARASVASIVEEATRQLEGGEIILLHDADSYASSGSWRNTLSALPRIIERVRAAGLEPSPIGGAGELAR